MIKKQKELIIILVAIILVIASIAVIYVINNEETNEEEIYSVFKDIPDSYSNLEQIEKIVELKIIDVFDDGSFRPNEKVKTGEFIKMVSKALWPNYVYKEPESGDHWATPYAYSLNHSILYAPGYDFEKLESYITREEAAEIICKFYLVLNDDKKLDKDETYIKECMDESEIVKSSSRNYINGCLQFGLMQNYSDGCFKPKEVMTRIQVAELFYIIIGG